MAASAARHSYQKPEQPSPPEISMAKIILVSLSMCFFMLVNGYLAQGRVKQRQFGECQLDSLDATEPTNRIEAEAGVIETWDPNNQQFRCAGVAVIRRTIERNGLLLPQYSNAPELVYVVRGRGITGVLFPGCPETFQEPQREFQQGPGQGREEGEGRRFQRDLHQKIRHFREGDILALPAGVAHWCYNDGDSPVVTVSLLHTNNFANQLDENPRHFYFAGNPVNEHRQHGQQQFEQGRRGQGREFRPHREPGHQGEQKGSGNNLFSGFDAEFLADAFNVDVETARRLQCNGDERRNIVRVEGRLQVVRPPWSHEERERQEGREREWEQRRCGGSGRCDNGLEETVCSLRLRENIGDLSRADIYTEQAGRINTVNSNNLPVLRWLRLSAERGDLFRDAIFAPQWNMNAHSVLYAIRGRARLQVVDDFGQTVFDGELRQGQVLPVPQFYAVAKRASSEGFEWVAFKTNDNAMTNPLAGRTSALRALPDEVLANSYRISREEARRLKYNRQEATLFRSSRSSPGRAAE